jgi:hypothetical protein
MRYLIELDQVDNDFIDKVLLFTNHESFDEKYEYAGNMAIASSVEQWENECNPCCGQFNMTINCPSGQRVFFCFDYGH